MIERKPNIDLTKNPKQAEYFINSLAAAQYANQYKFLNYGGAVRGGKTFVTLAILLRLSHIFPGSRSHVIRESMPALQASTIPSFEKLIQGSPNWKFNRDKSNYFAYNKEDSKIFFKGENISRDPSLMSFLGLETNFIFLEQSEELSETLWDKALERVGSWYIPKMPKGLIFQTFNPCQNWVRKKIYDPYINGTLDDDILFMSALPSENPFVTEDQWAGWSKMAGRYQSQFIEGDWTDFDGETNRWAFAFNSIKHVGKVEWNPNEPTYVSFDFNRNPIVCSVWQHYDNIIRAVRVIKMQDSTVYRLCDEILQLYPDAFFFITGDISGSTLTTLSSMNNFDVIKASLNLSKNQMQYSGANPRLKESRMLCNSMLEKYPFIIDEENCSDLIFDLKNCKANSDGTIIKDSRAKLEQQADTLDTFRYYIHRYFVDYMKYFAQ